MSSSPVQELLITSLPNLQAFAVALYGDSDLADDLMQETTLKAWPNLHSFTEETNLWA